MVKFLVVARALAFSGFVCARASIGLNELQFRPSLPTKCCLQGTAWLSGNVQGPHVLCGMNLHCAQGHIEPENLLGARRVSRGISVSLGG